MEHSLNLKNEANLELSCGIEVNKYSETVNLISRTKTIETARAEGEKIRLIGGAEAKAVEAVGR